MTLHRFAQLTAVCTFGLLVAGGLVTSTDSGLAVPDWPLSYGMWFPPMVGGILYEHGHRMIAGIVGLMIMGLAIWLWRTEPRAWVRRLGYAAATAVIVQALLGGLTVLWLLPPAVSIAHACLGQVVFCVVVCVAYGTRDGWAEASSRFDETTRTGFIHPFMGRVLSATTPLVLAAPHYRRRRLRASGGPGSRHPPHRGMYETASSRWLRTHSAVMVLVVVGQLLLGAVIRHTGAEVTWHLVGAAVLILMAGGWVARVAVLHDRMPVVWGHTVRLLFLIGAQVVLGVVTLGFRGSAVIRTSHVGVGALVLAQAVLLAWEICCRFRRFPKAISPIDLVEAVSAKSAPHKSAESLKNYLELTKPRLSVLVLVTAAAGFWVGMRTGEALGRMVPLLLGMGLVTGGANALNQWSERDRDALMERTKRRPLPAGRLSPEAACRFGLVLSVAGLLILGIAVDPLSSALAVLGWALYVLVYTPMKRWTPLCTLVGAIPGALPPVIGWAGARHALGLEAWALFAILFVWQLPHFLALAVLYRDDYARAGFPMLPMVEVDGLATARQIFLYGMALVPVSLFPATIGVANATYFYGAIVLSLAFLVIAARAAWIRSSHTARVLFRASVLYLPGLLGLLACTRVS